MEPRRRFSFGGRRAWCRFISGIALSLVGAVQGCAFAYTDSNGDRHAIGLLDVSVRAPADPQTLAGDVVEITSLGLSVGETAQGGYLTAGFNRQTTAELRDNALVLGNPITALAANRHPDQDSAK